MPSLVRSRPVVCILGGLGRGRPLVRNLSGMASPQLLAPSSGTNKQTTALLSFSLSFSRKRSLTPTRNTRCRRVLNCGDSDGLSEGVRVKRKEVEGRSWTTILYVCCRVVISCPSGRGGLRWGVGRLMSSKVLGRVFGWREGGRVQGSEFLGVWPRPLAGGVSAERCGGWTGRQAGRGVWVCGLVLLVCIGRARAKGLAPLHCPGG